ncbi:MAG: glycosyltransferase [Pseudomonadota bacterium]
MAEQRPADASSSHPAEPEAAPQISAVVCAKNEGARIEACLQRLKAAAPAEIIVVDGASSDDTAEIARAYADKVIVSDAGGLTADRQVGIDAASHPLIAMIDADHRIEPGDLRALYGDLEAFGFDIVQAGVRISPLSFWCRAEDAAFGVFHRKPGPRAMIGTAPALYRADVFNDVRFDAHITRRKDDADFFYRLSKNPLYTYGVGRTEIMQEHFGRFADYVSKFLWYGAGDAEFCRKHPERAASMVFHLLVRYPVLRSAQAASQGAWAAIPYFVVCGLARFAGLARGVLKAETPPAAAPTPAEG